ncbi:HAD family hydrolase [Peristeroidobacter agariperforans]|uniref:HAD family hydrolase n=1 Tax=Peristeroidobacter agariperforans TaxID=268404 RepID=UPI00101DF049|nr:HAD family hydrolase [Peristeroidobacter agariperforans]
MPQRSCRILLFATLLVATAVASADPLASWADGAGKKAIVDFVAGVTREDSADYVPPRERIAVFDNDGTLWAEQPIYFQFAFAIDRVKTLASVHPEWRTTAPFKDLLAGDTKALAASGKQGLLQVMAAAHTGITTEDFSTIVGSWLATAKHPRFQRQYTELAYQPMLELLDYLRSQNFKTFIVSGGGVEFMRVFAEQVYGIPPEQVIGSSAVTKFVPVGTNGKPALIKEPQVEFIDDGPGKPSGINRFIGRRPLLAFGNSDGDLQMLQWTAGGAGPRFVALLHHTDADREYAYDRQSPVGKLDKALDEARRQQWLVVDMKRDWLRIFSAGK